MTNFYIRGLPKNEQIQKVCLKKMSRSPNAHLMPLPQMDERPWRTGVHRSADAVQVKAEREFAATDPSVSVHFLSVSQNPLWRACDLVPFAAMVALHVP